MSDKLTRRRMVALTGSLAVAGLAGCGESSGTSGGGTEPSSTTEGSHDEHTESGHHEGEHTEEKHHGGEQTESGHSHSHGDLPSSPSPTAEVHMKTENGGYHFAPHIVWVEKGGTVTWTLESGTHNTVAYAPANDRTQRIPDGADAWQSELLSEAGATVEHTFDTEGVYDYYCRPHESLGMIGTVIVGHPDPHKQPALEKPQSSLGEEAQTKITELNEKVNKALGHTH